MPRGLDYDACGSRKDQSRCCLLARDLFTTTLQYWAVRNRLKSAESLNPFSPSANPIAEEELRASSTIRCMADGTKNAGHDPPEDDLLLVGRVLAGDRTAFETLVRVHERRVFRLTLAILGNVEDAEEAMQDCFLKLFRHSDQFRKGSRFTTWLTRIAVNEALPKG